MSYLLRMESPASTRSHDFPAQISQAEIETVAVRASFTWGPQGLYLLFGLVWFFYFLIRDIPDVAHNTVFFGLGATLLAAAGLAYDIRRRKRQTVLYPLNGQIALYRGGTFQYSFAPAEMQRQRLDFFGWMMVVLKLLLPMFLLMLIAAVLLLDGMKHAAPNSGPDVALFAYIMGFAIFGFVALYRSHIKLVFFWLPDEKGKLAIPLYLHPREIQKVIQGDGRPIG